MQGRVQPQIGRGPLHHGVRAGRGIAQASGHFVGFKLDDDHAVAPGIRAELEHAVGDFNYGITHVLFNGGTPVVTNTLGHPNTCKAWTVKIL